MRGHEPQQFSVLCIGFSCNNIKQQIGGQHYELLFLERLLKFSRTAKQDCNWNLHFSSCLFFGTHLFQAKLKFKWNRISTINPSPKSFLDLISKIFFPPELWHVLLFTEPLGIELVRQWLRILQFHSMSMCDTNQEPKIHLIAPSYLYLHTAVTQRMAHKAPCKNNHSN